MAASLSSQSFAVPASSEAFSVGKPSNLPSEINKRLIEVKVWPRSGPPPQRLSTMQLLRVREGDLILLQNNMLVFFLPQLCINALREIRSCCAPSGSLPQDQHKSTSSHGFPLRENTSKRLT